MAAFRLAHLFRRPLSELDITATEFWYWQAFLTLESEGYESEPEPMTMEQQLEFMRGMSNG